MNSLSFGMRKQEKINGVWQMLASGSLRHGAITRNVCTIFANHLKGSVRRVYTDTIDIVLDQDNTVISDVSILCGKDKLGGMKYYGAPLLAVEVLSRSSLRRDSVEKLELYERHGVKECWVVDPSNRAVYQYVLHGDKYDRPNIYTLIEQEEIQALDEKEATRYTTMFKPRVLENLTINLEDVFED